MKKREESDIIIQGSAPQDEGFLCSKPSLKKEIEKLAKQASKQLAAGLAYVEFSPPQNDEHSFRVRVIRSCSRDQGNPDLPTHWLPQEVSITSLSVIRVPFLRKENPNKPLFFTEIRGTVETDEACAVLRRQAQALRQELQLAFTSPNNSYQVLSTRSPSSSTLELRELCIKQLLRHNRQDSPELLEELQRFLLSTDLEFKSLRSSAHLLQIVRAHYWLRHQYSIHKISNETEKQLYFRVFPAKLQYAFGSKNIISLAVSLRSLSTYEQFDHRHMLLACQRSIPSLEMIPRSFFAYSHPEESTLSLYMEIAKGDGSLPTLSEWLKLKRELSRELVSSIEQVVSRIDIPQNEEDLLRNLLLLSQQIRGTKETPQVIIQFTGQTDDALDFHVTLVRVIKEGDGEIPSPPNDFAEIVRFIPLRISVIDKLRHRYVKQGVHFLVQCAKEPFLRRDRSIDFLKTRESVLRYVESTFGKVRDLNGGLIYQQHQLLEGIRPLLTKEETKEISIIEDLFHSITPSIMKNLLGPEHILTIFRQFLSLRDEGKEKGSFDVQEYAKAVFVSFEYPESFTKEDILQSRSKFQIEENQLAVSNQIAEGRQFCFVICSHNEAKTRKALLSWLKEKVCDKKRAHVDQVLRISLPRPTLVLDPRIGTDRTSGTVIKMLYEGLMRLDLGGTPTHAIAEEVIVSDNAKTYTFKLRQSFWSNGKPLTAHDFEYAWKKILEPSFHTIFDYLLHPILNARLVKAGRLPVDSLGIRTISDHVLVVELERPTPHFLELCCLWIYSPLCREVDQTYPGWAYYGDRSYVCNGPFKLTKWGRNSGIRVQKNEWHWDKDRVGLERIDISIIEDPLQALHLFEQGELDWLGEPLSETPMCVVNQDHSRVKSHPMSAVQWYEINVQHLPFRSAKVRRALSYALDRQGAIDLCLGGRERASHSILPTDLSLLENQDPLQLNREYAKQLFQEGLEEQGLTVADLRPVNMVLYDQEPLKSVAKVAIKSWKETLGLSVNITILGWHEFFEKGPSIQHDIWANVWYSWYRDPMYSFEVLTEKTSSMNLCNWSNKEFIGLVESAKAEQEKHRRNFFLRKAEEVIMHEMPIIPVFDFSARYLKNGSLENVYISHLGNVDFKWARFKTEESQFNPQPTKSESKNAKTIRLYLQGEPISLDPRMGSDRQSQQVIHELFEGLSKMGHDGKPQLAMAESMIYSEDGLVYTFTLRSARWSNGTPVTAHDFEWSWKSMLDSSLVSMYAHTLFLIKNAQNAYLKRCSANEIGIKALDDKTLQLTLEYPVPYLLALLSHPVFSPVCKATAIKNPAWSTKVSPDFVCNGPFILKDRKALSHVILEKNPQYWCEDQTKNDIVSFRIIEDPKIAYNLYQSNDLDWYGSPLGNIALDSPSTSDEKSDFIQKESDGIFWLQCRVQLPHLASPNIRRAIACSINRQEICDSFLPLSEIPVYTHVPSRLSSFKNATFPDNNTEYTQALFDQGLQELGYTKESYPPLIISSLSDPMMGALARKMQLQIQRTLGIRVEIALQDWDTYVKKFSSREFQLLTSLWFPWIPDTLHALLFFKDKTNPMNTSGWENTRYQRLLESAIKSQDPLQRQKLLKNAETLLLEEMPSIPIISHTHRYKKSANLFGEVFSPLGTMETSWLEKVNKKGAKIISSPELPPSSKDHSSSINLYLQFDPLSLDPRQGGDRRSLNVLRNMFEGLTRLNSEGKPALAIAQSISISKDECTYTFKLRPSKWSNGQPLTAEDFAWGWKSLLEPGFSTEYAYAFFVIKNAKKARNGECSIDEVGVTALDDSTLEVTLEYPSPFFLEFTALPLYAPLYRAAAEKGTDWAKKTPLYVSNGPFCVNKYEKNSLILLKRNPFYWDEGSVSTEEVSFSIIKDPHVAYNLFKKGRLDWYGHPYGELSPEIAFTLDQEHSLFKKETCNSFWLSCWTKTPHLASAKIRKALACAINRKEICATYLHKSDTPAQSFLPPPLSLLEKPTFKDNDIEFAQKLFEKEISELGYTKETYPPIELLCWSDPSTRIIAEIISLQLQHALGITVKIISKEWRAYHKAKMLGLHHLCISFWHTWFADPSYNLNYLKFFDNGINDAGWENATYVRLLNLSDTTREKEKRKKYLQQAEAFVMNELPVIPLFNQTCKFTKSPALVGDLITPVGHVEIKKAYKKQPPLASKKPLKELQTPKSSKATPPPTTLQLYLQSEPFSLDPRQWGDNRSLCVLKRLFEGLTKINDEGKPELALAQSVAISNNNTVYTFQLRPCMWSNGRPVTAGDFVWAWKSVIDPEYKTKYSYLFFVIKNAQRARKREGSLNDVGVLVLDDQTLQVHLEHPSPSFLELISLPPFSPLCQTCNEENSEWTQKTAPNYVSNGPYILKTHESNVLITLEQNPNYWNKEAVKVQTLNFSITSDPYAAYSLFQRGELDWYGSPLGEIPMEVASQLDSCNQLIKRQTGTIFQLSCFTKTHHLSSAKIRKAIACAINRQEICDSFLNEADIPTASILPPQLSQLQHPTFDDNNPDLALQLFQEGLSELGYTNNSYPPLVIAHWADPTFRLIAEIICLQLQYTLGLTITLSSQDWATFLSNLTNGKYQIALTNGLSLLQDPMYTLQLLDHNTSDHRSESGWISSEYSHLLSVANTSADKKLRETYLQQAETLVMEHLPVIPLFTQTCKFVTSSRLDEKTISSMGCSELKDSYTQEYNISPSSVVDQPQTTS